MNFVYHVTMAGCSICGRNHKSHTSYIYWIKNREKIAARTRAYRLKRGNAWNTANCKRYRQTAKGKEAVQRAVKKYESKNLERRRAWGRVSLLPNNLPCETKHCTSPVTHKHHPDISKPLEFISLCPLHHKKAHQQQNVI